MDATVAKENEKEEIETAITEKIVIDEPAAIDETAATDETDSGCTDCIVPTLVINSSTLPSPNNSSNSNNSEPSTILTSESILSTKEKVTLVKQELERKLTTSMGSCQNIVGVNKMKATTKNTSLETTCNSKNNEEFGYSMDDLTSLFASIDLSSPSKSPLLIKDFRSTESNIVHVNEEESIAKEKIQFNLVKIINWTTRRCQRKRIG